MRFRSILLCAFLATTAVACASPTEDTSADLGEGEDNFTVDIKKSEALLNEAVAMAEQRNAAGDCPTKHTASDVLKKVREAIAVRDTPFFRTKVVATKHPLVVLFEGTLAWQEILGVYNPKKPETLANALSAGVLFSQTPVGHERPPRVIAFMANGVAMRHERIDFGDQFKSQETTWKTEGSTIKLGTGESLELFEAHDWHYLENGNEMGFFSGTSDCSE